eukprot:Sspe_Gene.41975::Locus_20348_Transcript_1_1_Confidence_1.000_Length_2609::g.41975::m.41975
MLQSYIGTSPTATTGSAGGMTGGIATCPPEKTRALWTACEQCITSFNPNTHTVDTHCREFLAGNKSVAPEEADFVHQVFYGTSRFGKMLEGAVNKYLSVMRRMNDCFTSLVILTYLVMFRIDEIGIKTFKSLIQGCCSSSRIAEYLRFLFEEGSAERHCVPLWKTIYDDEFVEQELLAHIHKLSHKMLSLASTFDSLVAGEEQRKQQQASGGRATSTRPPITQVPFNLSKPRSKPVMVPEPESPPKRPPRPTDTATEQTRVALDGFKKGRMLSTLDTEKALENRKREERLKFRPPQLALKERPEHGKVIQAKMEAELEDALRPEFPCRPTPDEVRRKLAKSPAEEPKLTNAALLREEAVYRRKEEEELHELNKKAIEMRDDSEFKKWQQEMLAKDEAAARAAVAQRKVEMMLADEEAKAARRREEQRKAVEAARVREELDEQLQASKEEQMRLLAENAEFVVRHNKLQEENLKRVKEQLAEEKRNKAAVIKEEDKMLELAAAQQMELLHQRRAEIIATIREERQRIKDSMVDEGRGRFFKKEFDPESTCGAGTLGELSLAELQQKLHETREYQEQVRSERHRGIEEGRAAAKEARQRREEAILRRRQMMRQEKAIVRDTKKADQEAAAEKQRQREDDQLQALQGKLAEKRERRKREQEERRDMERKRRLEQQMRAADEGAVELKKWEGKEKGMENIAKRTQKHRMVEQAIDTETKRKEAWERERNTKSRITEEKNRRAEQQAFMVSRRQAQTAKSELEAERLRGAAHIEHSQKLAVKAEKDVNPALSALATLTRPLTH